MDEIGLEIERQDVRVVSLVDVAIERVFYDTSVCRHGRNEGRHSGDGSGVLHTG